MRNWIGLEEEPVDGHSVAPSAAQFNRDIDNLVNHYPRHALHLCHALMETLAMPWLELPVVGFGAQNCHFRPNPAGNHIVEIWTERNGEWHFRIGRHHNPSRHVEKVVDLEGYDGQTEVEDVKALVDKEATRRGIRRVRE